MSDNTAPKRRFILSDRVEEKTVKDIITGIYDVNDYDNEQEESLKEYKRKPIELIINTFGGEMYDGFALAAAIVTSRTPIHTITLGKAMSMGFLLAVAGHKRFAHNLTTFMYHDYFLEPWGKSKKLKREIGEADRLMKQYDEFILKRTKLSKEQLDRVKENEDDWYISAQEALEYGIVDELL